MRPMSNGLLSVGLLLTLVGCPQDNDAPSGGIEVTVTSSAEGFSVSWPAGSLVEVQMGRCLAACEETESVDPTSELSERVPAPVFAELSWHVSVPAGAASPLRLGQTPLGGRVLVPYAEPDTERGAWAVFIVVERPRLQDTLTQVGVARLN